MTPVKQRLHEGVARLAGKRPLHWHNNVLYVESDGCKGGVAWRPCNDGDDALELAIKASVELKAWRYTTPNELRAAIFNQASEMVRLSWVTDNMQRKGAQHAD
jgi:hypothetical protein